MVRGEPGERQLVGCGQLGRRHGPQADDNHVFSAGAAHLTNLNDFAAGIHFRSVTFQGSGYNVSGNGLTLVEGVVAGYASGSSIFTAPIALAAPQTFDTANAGAPWSWATWTPARC